MLVKPYRKKNVQNWPNDLIYITTHMNVIVNGRECNSDKEWNNNKCQCKFKNPKNIVCGKNFIF